MTLILILLRFPDMFLLIVTCWKQVHRDLGRRSCALLRPERLQTSKRKMELIEVEFCSSILLRFVETVFWMCVHFHQTNAH